MAVEVMMSEFDVFRAEPIQNNVDGWRYREFTPLSALQHGSPIEFAVPGSPMLTLDLAKSYISVRAKITTPGDAAPANTINVGPINLTLHSLFSNVDIELGGKMITDPNGLYPYRAYLEIYSHTIKMYKTAAFNLKCGIRIPPVRWMLRCLSEIMQKIPVSNRERPCFLLAPKLRCWGAFMQISFIRTDLCRQIYQ